MPGVFTEKCQFYSPPELSYHYELTDQKVMVNVGSVGQPRDNDPRSSYVVLDGKEIEFRRIEYPFEITREKILQIAELDDFLGERLAIGH